MRRVLSIALLWMLGCGGPGPLKVAVVTDLQKAKESEDFLRGARYALQAAPKESSGLPVELLSLKPSELSAHLKEVTVVLAGPMDPGKLQDLLALCDAQKRPVLVGASHGADLTRFAWAWRIPINEDYLANAAAFFAVKMLKKQRLAVLYDSTWAEAPTLWRNLQHYLQVYKTPRPPAVLTPEGLSARQNLRRWLRRHRPEVLFYLAPPNEPGYLGILRKAGYRGAVIGFHEWYPEPRAGGAVYTVTDFCAADPRIRDFVDRYAQATGKVPGLCDALGYDAVQVILGVARRLETPSPELFAARMRTVRVEGLTGTLEFGTSHDPIGKRPLIVQFTPEGRKVVARPAVSPYR